MGVFSLLQQIYLHNKKKEQQSAEIIKGGGGGRVWKVGKSGSEGTGVPEAAGRAMLI